MKLFINRQRQFLVIKYPLADGSGSITIATTRPETMLGDTAVAINPKDREHRSFSAKKLNCRLWAEKSQSSQTTSQTRRRYGLFESNACARPERLRNRAKT
jgi:hypothetical protein